MSSVRYLFPYLLVTSVSFLLALSSHGAIKTQASGTATACEQLLAPLEGTYSYYAAQAEQRRGGDYTRKHPRFADPSEELAIAQTWQGELAPFAVQALLPEGITLIDHQLVNAEGPGVVKMMQPKGEFITLRASMEFEGREIAFHIATSASSLYENVKARMNGEPLYLFGSQTRAVIDWGHGGGTNSTGKQTADSPMNFMAKYGVGTLAIDQPGHAEGMRDHFHVFKSEQDYFRFRAALVRKFVHPNVPTFLVGHSKGGMVADMAHLRSGIDGIPEIREAYAGMVSLSFVPDGKPGGSFAEKTLAEKAKEIEQKERQWLEWVNPGDLNLFASLAEQGKCSALSMMFCSWLGLYNDWSLAERKDQDLLPMLAVMGAHDSLSATMEDLIGRYMGQRENTQLVYVTSRVDFRGDVDRVGHLIFDHLRPVRNLDEAEKVIRQFITQYYPQEDAGLPQAELKELFKRLVLPQYDRPSFFEHVANNYMSTLVLMAYTSNDHFQLFMDAYIQDLLENQQGIFSGKTPKGNPQQVYFSQYGVKGEMETYYLIKDFISQILVSQGADPLVQLERKKHPDAEGLAQIQDRFLPFVKMMANVLAFREFVDSYSWLETHPTEAYMELDRVYEDANRYLKLVDAIRKDRSKSPEEKETAIAELERPRDQNGQELDVITAEAARSQIYEIRKKELVPDSLELARFATENLRDRQDLRDQIKSTQRQRDETEKQKKQAERELEANRSRLEKAVLEVSSPGILQLRARQEEALNKLFEEEFRYRDLSEQLFVQWVEEGRNIGEALANPGPELVAAGRALMEASANYQKVKREVTVEGLEEARLGHLGEELQDLYLSVYGEDSLADLVERLTRRLDELNSRLFHASRESQELQAEYIRRVMPHLFEVKEVWARDVVNDPTSFDNLENFKRLVSNVEKIKSAFGPLWGQRPEGAASGLY